MQGTNVKERCGTESILSRLEMLSKRKETSDEDLTEVLDSLILKLKETGNYLSSGIAAMNFAEAGMIVQMLAVLYGKKVDALYSTFFSLEEELSTNLKKEEEKEREIPEVPDVPDFPDRQKRARSKRTSSLILPELNFSTTGEVLWNVSDPEPPEERPASPPVSPVDSETFKMEELDLDFVTVDDLPEQVPETFNNEYEVLLNNDVAVSSCKLKMCQLLSHSGVCNNDIHLFEEETLKSCTTDRLLDQYEYPDCTGPAVNLRERTIEPPAQNPVECVQNEPMHLETQTDAIAVSSDTDFDEGVADAEIPDLSAEENVDLNENLDHHRMEIEENEAVADNNEVSKEAERPAEDEADRPAEDHAEPGPAPQTAEIEIFPRRKRPVKRSKHRDECHTEHEKRMNEKRMKHLSVDQLNYESFYSLNYSAEPDENDVPVVPVSTPKEEPEDGSQTPVHDSTARDSAMFLTPVSVKEEMEDIAKTPCHRSQTTPSIDADSGNFSEPYSPHTGTASFCDPEHIDADRQVDDLCEIGAENVNSMADLERRIQQEVRCQGTGGDYDMERAGSWNEVLHPILERAEERSVFDIHEYGTNLLNCFSCEVGDDGSERSFASIVKRKPPEEIARYFVASLQLVNTGNVAFSEGLDGHLVSEDLKVTLLSRERYHEELNTFQAPSEETFLQRLAVAKAKNRQLHSTPINPEPGCSYRTESGQPTKRRRLNF